MCDYGQLNGRDEQSVYRAHQAVYRDAMVAEKKRHDAQTAHIRLAALIKDEIGHDISPSLLKLFIEGRWDKIAPLAHAIHRSGE